MKSAPIIYIASPYTSTSAVEQDDFYRRANTMMIGIVAAGGYPVSPVAMSHPLRATLDDMHDGEWWYTATALLLRRCDGVLAWSNGGRSRGVISEIGIARDHRIPCRIIRDPHKIKAASLNSACREIVTQARRSIK